MGGDPRAQNCLRHQPFLSNQPVSGGAGVSPTFPRLTPPDRQISVFAQAGYRQGYAPRLHVEKQVTAGAETGEIIRPLFLSV
jgi:hypothetical protein